MIRVRARQWYLQYVEEAEGDCSTAEREGTLSALCPLRPRAQGGEFLLQTLVPPIEMVDP